MAYKPELVANIKGALRAGLGPKLIASILERAGFKISADTIKEWSVGDRRDAIQADERVEQDIADVLLGRFDGRASTR